MREQVSALLTMIPADCKDLTIHDVSHLDALWEMASLIAGADYPLNPAEAFVFGASVLLHDAGLSAAAYPGGLDELKRNTAWQDVAADILRQNEISVSEQTLRSPPADLLPAIKFAVLRALHAEQAERLATSSFKQPNNDNFHLIDDAELRMAFGAMIGRIAHSHHWNIERVADALASRVGTGIVLPTEWTVNERKIACMLRCADATHIDRRRAPSILYSALRPTGVSAIHWGAQNKLNKPLVENTSLVYSSGSPFRANEATHWWLVYDLARLADKEIRDSNALLEESSTQTFRVNRIFGAENPRALSRHVHCDNWRPIDAEIRVSDPVQLARMLGGQRLYGESLLHPIRELVQNAVDTIRARRALENRSAGFGAIRISIEADAADPEARWLHVDDNGLGMSERVLSGPLIDFGKSIWRSSILREEFPGLQSKALTPIGRFGIGFFSVFDVADEVKVISRPHDAGASDALALEFHSIASRPIIRQATKNEIPQDYSTRVSLRIKNFTARLGKPSTINELIQADLQRRSSRRRVPRKSNVNKMLADQIKRLVCMVDVEIKFHDEASSESFAHSAFIYDTPADVFLDEFLAPLDTDERSVIKAIHASQLRPLVGADGTRYGRAAMMLGGTPANEHPNLGAVAVGGFVYGSATALGISYIGVVDGETIGINRSIARPAVPDEVVQQWISEQARIIDMSKFLKAQLMQFSYAILAAGGEPHTLPFAFNNGRLIDYGDTKKSIQRSDEIWIPLTSKEYLDYIFVVGYTDMGSIFFELPVAPNAFIFYTETAQLFTDLEKIEKKIDITLDDFVSLLSDDPDAGRFRRGEHTKLIDFLKLIEDVWQTSLLISITEKQIFTDNLINSPRPRHVLSITGAERR